MVRNAEALASQPQSRKRERENIFFLLWFGCQVSRAVGDEDECSIFSEIESFKDTRCGSFPGWVQKQKLEFSLQLKLKLKLK